MKKLLSAVAVTTMLVSAFGAVDTFCAEAAADTDTAVSSDVCDKAAQTENGKAKADKQGGKRVKKDTKADTEKERSEKKARRKTESGRKAPKGQKPQKSKAETTASEVTA